MKSECPKRIVLEGLFCQGRTPREIEDHVRGCPLCQEKMRQWTEEKEAFLRKYPFERFWEVVSSRRKRFWERLWEGLILPTPVRTAIAFAGIAGLIVFAVWRHQEGPLILTKGGVGLGFHVAHNGEIKRGENGMKIPPGDDLQFVYSAKEEGFLLLLGVEADQTVTVYYPHGGSSSASVEKGAKKSLPQAFRWQPKSAYERFYALFSAEPVSVEEVRSVLQKAATEGKTIEAMGRLPLPYPQVSILLYRK